MFQYKSKEHQYQSKEAFWDTKHPSTDYDDAMEEFAKLLGQKRLFGTLMDLLTRLTHS
jgi:hypothetical protein